MNKKDLPSTMLNFLILAFGMSLAFTVYASEIQTTFAQNQTNSTESCPYAHVVIDGVCKLDEVRKYKFGTMLLNMYNEYETSSRSAASDTGASGAAASSGSTDGSDNPIIPIVIAFEAYDCNLPEDFGIVHKGPCSTYHERASMGVRIPISNLYDVAALDHVTGIYPDFEPIPTMPPNPSLLVDADLSTDDTIVIDSLGPTTHDENVPYYIISVVTITIAIIGIVIISHVKKRGQIEA